MAIDKYRNGIWSSSLDIDRRGLLKSAGLAAGVLAAPAIFTRPAFAETTLDILTWPGHGDPEFVGPFEQKYGVKVRAKEYVGGEQMLAQINSVPPGTYDVILADREYVPNLRASGKLTKLTPADYPFDDLFPETRKIPALWEGDTLWAVPLRMMYLGLAYNSKYVTAEEASSYSILWDKKLAKKVGWFDWYLPSMGVLSLYNGNKDPHTFDISKDQFGKLKDTLFSLKDQTSGFYAFADIVSGFANESFHVLAGTGDALTQTLKSQGLPIETTIPKEGGLGVVESLGIVTGTKNPELAKQFIQYAMSPEGQVRSAILPAYVDYVPSMPAWDLLAERSPDWATRLRMRKDQHPNIIDELKAGKIAYRQTPTQQSIADWNKVWTEFKSL